MINRTTICSAENFLGKIVENDELLELAIHNQDMLIKLLLDHGASLEHEDSQGETGNCFVTLN